MAETLGFQDCIRMLTAAAEQIRAKHEMLSELDSHGGDGDHGVTMVRAMNQIEKGIANVPEQEIKALFKSVGWAIMGVDGGATGPLLGSLFMGMAEGTEERETLDARALVSVFESGLKSVRKYSKAQVSDKTIMDARVPAVEAARVAAENGGDVTDVLRMAAEAAERGAKSTTALQARFGRAKNIGERSIGVQDAGATSMWLLFKGFSEGVDSNAGQ
ncbi:MAG: dihydroxyacetone kinase subunit L [Candidatus Hydrogenedentes bacterium]|nr:dihydroxyacetone kinase subunit L [Candidatus Hydrogenedentota bacterium]